MAENIDIHLFLAIKYCPKIFMSQKLLLTFSITMFTTVKNRHQLLSTSQQWVFFPTINIKLVFDCHWRIEVSEFYSIWSKDGLLVSMSADQFCVYYFHPPCWITQVKETGSGYFMSNTDNPWKDEKKISFLGEITHLEKDNQINSILFNYERHNGK